MHLIFINEVKKLKILVKKKLSKKKTGLKKNASRKHMAKTQ